MSAITLTPVDPTTAAVVVNSDILYHVFTINGVTRVFFSKGGKSPYQIDVQETASAIAALCPNLIEVTTVNGAEYLFIGSGGAGPGLGIMFIENDGTGSKITFRYTEESGNTMFYSSDSPSVLAARINAQSPNPSNQLMTITVPVSALEGSTLQTNPVTLIPGVPGKSIGLVSVYFNIVTGSTPHLAYVLVSSETSLDTSPAFAINDSNYTLSGGGSFAALSALDLPSTNWNFNPAVGDAIVMCQAADEVSDSTYTMTLAYFLF